MLISQQASLLAQAPDSLTAPYPEALCEPCDEWNEAQEPFQIYGNSYYVGTHGLSSILVTSEDGHILIDGALPNSAPMILEHVRGLGFEPADIRLILNSHAHYDHAGGIAALQLATGARVAATEASASVIERGKVGPDDPQFGVHLDYPSVSHVEIFRAGDTLRVGPLELVSHATAGHTRGGTTWSWTECESDTCMEIVYADSQTPVSADGFRFTDSKTYPDALSDFESGFEVLERLKCDIMISTHPSASSLWERLAIAREGLVDPEACTEYAAAARDRLAARVSRESSEP